MKLVGLSGAQGGGKSTLLKSLMDQGWKLDKFRVSRVVQQMLGWDSLERVMDSPTTMMTFQNEVYEQKYANDFAISIHETPPNAISDVVLTERTFADIWAYTSMWTWRFYDRGDLAFDEALSFLTPFTEKCAAAQNKIYSGVLLLPLMENIIWEDDAHRAAKEDAQNVYEDVERFVFRKMPIEAKKLVIKSQSVQDRTAEVDTFLRGL